MSFFDDLNQRYPLHVRDHNLFTGGFLLALGFIGFTINQRPVVIFLALLITLISGLAARILLIHFNYTGGVRSKHVITSIVGVVVSAILILFSHWNIEHSTSPDFKKIVLPFFMANFLLTYVPFIIIDVAKRIGRRREG
jgi:FtsH-binding integral membrane protein